MSLRPHHGSGKGESSGGGWHLRHFFACISGTAHGHGAGKNRCARIDGASDRRGACGTLPIEEWPSQMGGAGQQPQLLNRFLIATASATREECIQVMLGDNLLLAAILEQKSSQGRGDDAVLIPVRIELYKIAHSLKQDLGDLSLQAHAADTPALLWPLARPWCWAERIGVRCGRFHCDRGGVLDVSPQYATWRPPASKRPRPGRRWRGSS